MSANDLILSAIGIGSGILAGWGIAIMVIPGGSARAARILFWMSAIGFGSLGSIWAANQEHLTAMNLTISGAIGAAAAVALAWVLWQVEHPAMAQDNGPPAASSDKSPVNVTGNNNVVSVGQTGGVTAGTYVNQVPQPELRLIEQKDEINPDGTHTTTFTVEVASQVTPAFLAIDITAQGILRANIMPPPVGGMAGIMLRNVRRSATDYHAELTSPRGRYFVSIQTQGQTPIRLAYQF